MPDDPTEVLRNVGALEAAEQRAFLRGQASAHLTAQVQSHEKRLDAINGSIERHANAQEATNDRLDRLTASVEKATAVAKTRADVAAELAKKTASQNVDKRTLIISLVVATTAIASALVAAVALFVGHL